LSFYNQQNADILCVATMHESWTMSANVFAYCWFFRAELFLVYTPMCKSIFMNMDLQLCNVHEAAIGSSLMHIAQLGKGAVAMFTRGVCTHRVS